MKDQAVIFMKGFIMGIAEIIPGISGGTIALLLGIYHEFITAIRSFDKKFFEWFLTGHFKKAFNHCHWRFLLVLVCGMGAAIFTLSHVISWLLDNHPVLIHAFFFGLILATGPIIARIVEKWSWAKVMALGGATIGTYFFVELVPIQTPDTPWFLFLCGAIAISAMILPGISGSFVLLLLGKYSHVLAMVKERDILNLTIFAAGVVFGILTFVRVLGWLFKRYHDWTLAVLAGFVLGSLNKIWPWKRTLSWMVDHRGDVVPIQQANILPPSYDLYLIFALLIMVVGYFMAFVLNPNKNKKVSFRGL